MGHFGVQNDFSIQIDRNFWKKVFLHPQYSVENICVVEKSKLYCQINLQYTLQYLIDVHVRL